MYFFVDDFKLYPANINKIEHQINIITAFSKDIGMTLAIDRCAYLHMKKGKSVKSGPLTINNLIIQPVATGDNYKYLAIEKNIEYKKPLNKERILEEHLSRVKKIRHLNYLATIRQLRITPLQHL